MPVTGWRGTFEIDAHKFEPIRTGTPKAFYGQHQPRVGMIGNRNHPAGQIVLLRPDVQQRLIVRAADFPGKLGQRREAAAIFTKFRGPGGNKFAKAGFQFCGQFHQPIINEVRNVIDIILKGRIALWLL